MGERNSYPTTDRSRGFSFMHLLFRFCLFICASYLAEYVAQTNLCVTDDAQIHFQQRSGQASLHQRAVVLWNRLIQDRQKITKQMIFVSHLWDEDVFVLHRRTIYETQNQILVKCRSTWSPLNSQAPGSLRSLWSSRIIMPARSFSSPGSNLSWLAWPPLYPQAPFPDGRCAHFGTSKGESM